MTQVLRVDQVFVTSGDPGATYVSRDAEVEERISERLRTGQEIVAVSGPSKSGKTVMVTRIIRGLGRQRVQVSGNDIDTLDDFWNSVASQIGVAAGSEASEQLTTTYGGGLEGQVGIAPVSVKTNVNMAQANGAGSKVTAAVDLPRQVRERLKAEGACLMIDDFHYIPEAVRGRVARSLKAMNDERIPVVMIAVPHRVMDLVMEERDLYMRVVSEKVSHWSPMQLMLIASQGFKALNLESSDGSLASALAQNSLGSPLLMQKLCAGLCRENGIREAQFGMFPLRAPVSWHAFFREIAETQQHPLARSLLAGPTQRRGRGKRKLKDLDHWTDNYGAVLLGLRQIVQASTAPEITEADLRTAVADILVVPMTLERIRWTCGKLRDTAESQRGEDDAALEWLPGPPKTLVVADPYLMFYIRWGLGTLGLPALDPLESRQS